MGVATWVQNENGALALVQKPYVVTEATETL